MKEIRICITDDDGTVLDITTLHSDTMTVEEMAAGVMSLVENQHKYDMAQNW